MLHLSFGQQGLARLLRSGPKLGAKRKAVQEHVGQFAAGHAMTTWLPVSGLAPLAVVAAALVFDTGERGRQSKCNETESLKWHRPHKSNKIANVVTAGGRGAGRGRRRLADRLWHMQQPQAKQAASCKQQKEITSNRRHNKVVWIRLRISISVASLLPTAAAAAGMRHAACMA